VPAVTRQPATLGRLRDAGIADDGAVVRNVTVAVAVPFAGMVIEEPELHVVSEGKPEHIGAIVTAPPLLNPFCAVNVSTVDPIPPGALTGIVVGFAITVNVGAGVTVSAAVALEAA
jgi:hypothetical protein